VKAGGAAHAIRTGQSIADQQDGLDFGSVLPPAFA
jgi:hypothetical protein